MATRPQDFPTSLNSGEPSFPSDTRVGETHPESPEEERGDHRDSPRPRPPKRQNDNEPEARKP